MTTPHLCLLDRECWKDWWRYGMPLRLYWGSSREHFVSVWPLNKWRFDQLWDLSSARVYKGYTGRPMVYRHVMVGDEWVEIEE